LLDGGAGNENDDDCDRPGRCPPSDKLDMGALIPPKAELGGGDVELPGGKAGVGVEDDDHGLEVAADAVDQLIVELDCAGWAGVSLTGCKGFENWVDVGLIVWNEARSGVTVRKLD